MLFLLHKKPTLPQLKPYLFNKSAKRLGAGVKNSERIKTNLKTIKVGW